MPLRFAVGLLVAMVALLVMRDTWLTLTLVAHGLGLASGTPPLRPSPGARRLCKAGCAFRKRVDLAQGGFGHTTGPRPSARPRSS